MANFNVFRETALPGSLQPYSLYFVAPATRPDYVEIYATGSTTDIVKRVINKPDIEALVDTKILTRNSIEIVADINARNALTPAANMIVLVLDAGSDNTVTGGAATYAYRQSTGTWTKISEAESLDLVFDWNDIQNKPTSTVSAIDDAVSKRHTHTNKTELDKIGENSENNFTYNDALPVIAWASTGW